MPYHKLFWPRHLPLSVCALALLCLFALWCRHQAAREVPFPINLLSQTLHSSVTLCGFGGVEGFRENRLYTWGMGPTSQIGFVSPFSGQVVLVFSASSPCIPNQSLTVVVNGKTLGNINGQTQLPSIEEGGLEIRIPFPVQRGYNTVHFRYADWNHGNHVCVVEDTRRFAVRFSQLAIIGTP